MTIVYRPYIAISTDKHGYIGLTHTANILVEYSLSFCLYESLVKVQLNSAWRRLPYIYDAGIRCSLEDSTIK